MLAGETNESFGLLGNCEQLWSKADYVNRISLELELWLPKHTGYAVINV